MVNDRPSRAAFKENSLVLLCGWNILSNEQVNVLSVRKERAGGSGWGSIEGTLPLFRQMVDILLNDVYSNPNADPNPMKRNNQPMYGETPFVPCSVCVNHVVKKGVSSTGSY